MKLHILLIKLANIFSSLGGWLIAIITAFITYFAGHKFMLEMVLLSVVMDMVWGIVVSVKNKRFILSELARCTIEKVAIYGTVLVIFIGIDKLIGGETVITATIVATLIIMVELWSSLANMSIIYPNMPFLRLLRRALVGEIARKLNVDESIVNIELSEKNEKN